MRSGKLKTDLLSTLVHLPKHPNSAHLVGSNCPFLQDALLTTTAKRSKKITVCRKTNSSKAWRFDILPTSGQFNLAVSNVLVWFDEIDTLTLSYTCRLIDCLYLNNYALANRQKTKQTFWPQHLISASNISQLLLPCLLKETYILLCKMPYALILISIPCCR